MNGFVYVIYQMVNLTLVVSSGIKINTSVRFVYQMINQPSHEIKFSRN